MADLVRAKEPFRFYTRLNLTELTGLAASNLVQLSDLIKQVPGASIYQHTHRFLQQHLYLSPEPPNDFAYWITTVLGEDELGEKLASIDTIQFSTIHGLREKIAGTIEGYLKDNPRASSKFAHKDEEFHFMKSVSFILPTPYAAYNLREFADILGKVTIDSIYFHIFEARLRLEKGANDFSSWIETSLGNKKLANEIAKLDPYVYTLEDLRKKLIKIVEKGIPR
ncbi:MAG: DUF5752 family protein [Candidatus Omnitrophica bacterium]|nr:DUF5752 family protein [Candidatus Omnitrophota bacterium]